MDQVDSVQPEGQGAPPYQEYLERIPEQYRGEFEPVFQDWDKNVTQKFQEQAQYRKQWEPYEQLGVNSIPVNDMQGLVAFHDAVNNNPQAIAEWYQTYAQQAGLVKEPETEFGDDPDISSTLNQLLQQNLNPIAAQLNELAAWRQAQEEQVAVAQAEQLLEQQFQQLTNKHGEVPRDWIEKLIGNYIETDPDNAVERAFRDYEQIVASAQNQMVTDKLRQPPAALRGGVANTAVDPAKDFDEAKRIALAKLGIT